MAIRLLTPDHYYGSVHAIDLRGLRAAGVTALLVDLDNTLLPRDTNVVDDGARAWVASARDAGLAVCFVSNNFHERVLRVADELGGCIVAKAVKPLPFAFRKALRMVGAAPAQAAVIGDQLFTDVLGGNLVGATTVLVAPLSATDLPHTLLLRRLEARVLAGRRPLA